MWEGKVFAAADADAVNADAAETDWKHKVTPERGDLMINSTLVQGMEKSLHTLFSQGCSWNVVEIWACMGTYIPSLNVDVSTNSGPWLIIGLYNCCW